jgi:hypothetical protein
MTGLAQDYKCIAIWGMMLRSYPYYIAMQQAEALKDEAPLTAIYKDCNTGKWVTADQIKSEETRKELINRLARAAKGA